MAPQALSFHLLQTACEVTISRNNDPRQSHDAYIITGHPLCARVGELLPKLSRTPWNLHVDQTHER